MKAFLRNIAYKIVSVVVSVLMLFGITVPGFKADDSNWNTNYKYVFVHGLSGWGSYDAVYKLMPYWGMFGGDLMAYLNDKGFDCYAASVSPTLSAWDRSCELYAQLTGTVVDYGEAHSKRCNHERYGTDYTGRALIDKFDSEHKINILGHSFGGATVRLFASMMETGSAEEQATTTDGTLSDFFKGGKGDYIHSLVALAAPHNGTTAYNTGETPAPQPTPEEAAQLAGLGDTIDEAMDSVLNATVGERIADDYASYDMYIDNALALNETILTLENTYYFSIACNATEQNEDGTYSPVKSKMESLFIDSSAQIGAYTGVTKGGYVIDESWQMNDGLVNTLSALAPFNAPQKDYEEGNVQTGIWNIMPIYDGDHMALQGGLLKTNDVKDLYVDLLSMINSLA